MELNLNHRKEGSYEAYEKTGNNKVLFGRINGEDRNYFLLPHIFLQQKQPILQVVFV